MFICWWGGGNELNKRYVFFSVAVFFVVKVECEKLQGLLEMQKTLATLLAATVLAGCTSASVKPSHWESADPRYRQLDLETDRMIKSIESSLLVLAETRRGGQAVNSTPEEMREREWLFRVTPPGMGVPITVNDFRGHPESIIDMVASMTGYTIEKIGVPAAATRNVTVSFVSRPAVEILRSVAVQMSCDGLVDVQGATRKIVVDWTIRKRGEC